VTGTGVEKYNGGAFHRIAEIKIGVKMYISRYVFSVYEYGYSLDELNKKFQGAENITVVPAPFNKTQNGETTEIIIYATYKGGESRPLEQQVTPLLIKDEISQKLINRLNMFEKQMASDYGFANKQKISHKIKELKKCIQIVQSA
jgi:hypothetical protein